MQLKSLELIGFKSFAKKTVIDFVPGVTAIVGPNGSGKSNVVDAIRWVLAEQSFKTLRGRKGEDLIFHGSGIRTAMARAHVALTLINTGEAAIDTAEVVLAREVTKAGESSYFLNGRAVRLSDLEAYLASSAVGSGSFRILSQGMSDMLIGLGPQELRLYIEEAAGLKEFQDKKRRSLKKLERATMHLGEVALLRAELAPQLKLLRREARRISERQTTEDRLRELARTLYGARLSRLIRDERRVVVKKGEYSRKISQVQKDLSRLEETLKSRMTRTKDEEDLQTIRKNMRSLQDEERDIERALMRAEHERLIEEERAKKTLPVTAEYLKKSLQSYVHEAGKYEKVRSYEEGFRKLLESIQDLLHELIHGARLTEDHGASLKRLETRTSELQTQRGKLLEEIHRLDEERDRLEQEYFSERKTIVADEIAYREHSDELRMLERELGKFEIEEERIRLQKEKLGGDLEHIEVLTLADISGMEETVLPNDEEEKLEKQLWSTKRIFDTIGSIDPAVAVEYAALEERYGFLEKEEADLRSTIDSLKNLAQELDTEMDKRFETAFKDISSYFDHNVHLMFNGGNATLSLIHAPEVELEDEALEREDGEEETLQEEREKEGIQVVVELPAKKIKNLSMLSGGERTLVSIALLFALVALRRPPFLVLDEIDAALDEANTRRFIELIRDRAAMTQLVIITHNRETMSGADALYGVSMKNGISNLLSLKLEGPLAAKLTE